MASEEVILDRDLFLNLGRVQNLSLNVKGLSPLQSAPAVVIINDDSGSGGADSEEPLKLAVRPTLSFVNDDVPRELGNPVTSYIPNRPRGVFLNSLDISLANWDCSCDGIG